MTFLYIILNKFWDLVGDFCYIKSLHVLMNNFVPCMSDFSVVLVLHSWHRQRQLVWQNFAHKEYAHIECGIS
jgi:hypothetical protein